MLRERAVAFRLTAMASDTVAIAATFLAAAWARAIFREVYTLDLIPGLDVFRTTSVTRHMALVPVIVLARLLNPHAFGLIAFGMAVVLFGSLLADGGLGAGLIRRAGPIVQWGGAQWELGDSLPAARRAGN